MNIRAWIAELIGTFVFVFVGVGSVVIAAMPENSLGLLGVAFAHGIAIAVVATAIGPISGGHVNPAVSIGAWLVNKLSFGNLIGYVIGQVAGAAIAVGALIRSMPNNALVDAQFGIPTTHPTTSFWQAFAIEAVLTFVLMFVVYGTTMHRRAVAMGGWFVGMVVLMGSLVAGPLTGACFNPARFFGPAVWSGAYTDAVLYSAAPILGAALAALVFHYWLAGKEEPAAA